MERKNYQGEIPEAEGKFLCKAEDRRIIITMD